MKAIRGFSMRSSALVHWALCAVACVLLWGMAPTTVSARAGYLRYPDIHGGTVVFTAEGDLWLASLDGREVRRLTTHPGNEILARFSPDGAWIAFAGDYDGNRDVFVIPATGGEPRRLTWHPAWDEPLGWSADGTEVIFRSGRDHPVREAAI